MGIDARDGLYNNLANKLIKIVKKGSLADLFSNSKDNSTFVIRCNGSAGVRHSK